MATTLNTYPYPMPGCVQASPVGTPGTGEPGQPRLLYFITRNNGMCVPLIPADELPFNVKLQNVSRVLSPDQVYGLYCVGSVPYTGATFKLESSTALPMHRSTSQPCKDAGHVRSSSTPGIKHFLAPDALARQAMMSNNQAFSPNGGAGCSPNLAGQSSFSKRPPTAAETAKSWRRTEPLPILSTPHDSAPHTTQSVIDAILSSSAGAETAERLGYRSHHNITPPPSGVIPDQEKKEYCTYWILHGDCAYVQQGCRYKHEMPDKAKLAGIGINHVPRWWLERSAPVRMGAGRGAVSGRTETVGPVVKPEVWLKARQASDADSEGGSSEAATVGGSVTSEEEKPTPLKQPGARKNASKCKNNGGSSNSPAVPPTRPPTPAQPKDNSKATTGGDLIDFTPLIPAPSSSAASTGVPSTPSSSVSGTNRDVKPKPATKTARVFVPRGESPEHHIAEARQRDQRQRVSRNKTARTPSPTESSKAVPRQNHVEQNKPVNTTGLCGSRWALGTKRGQAPVATRSKSGCRIRRPASSPPSEKK